MSLRLLFVILALAGCKVHRTYECANDSDCQGAGGGAMCEATRYCSFIDSACTSGRRYDDYAGEGLANKCVGESGEPDAAIPDAPQAPNCPAGYIVVAPLAGGYRYSMPTKDWDEAEADCEDDSGGTTTHLVILEDAGENTALRQTFSTATTEVWIGVTDRNTEGTYKAVTNVVQMYLPWDTGQPNNPPDDCVWLQNEKFDDEDCTDDQPFLCECDGVPPVPASYAP